ncbi:MAG: hypothetical protein ACHQ3P_06280 [Candidatus Limnocylindrales bacterium]
MAIDPTRPSSRRAVLTAALGGAAALGVQAFASAPGVRAGVDGDLVLNTGNAATALTGLDATLAMDTVLNVTNSATGPGTAIQGNDSDGTGVAGYSGAGNGLYGDAMGVGNGVHATSGTGTGVWAAVGPTTNAATHPDTDYTGVYGFVDQTGLPSGFIATGVWGDSADGGEGVYGSGGTGVVGVGGWGMYGWSNASGGVGVYADSTSPAKALVVNGKAHFSRSGKLKFGSKSTSVAKAVTGLTSAAMIIAVLNTNRSGVYVRAAVAATGKFTVYLNKAPGATVYAAYLILD